MKVSLLNTYLNNDNNEALTNIAAAMCIGKHEQALIEESTYKDEYKNENLKAAINSNHLSVIEHISFTFLIENISRACSHQLVRHRHFSFSQLSQRYSKINTNNKWYIIPNSIENNLEAVGEYCKIMQQIEYFYDSYPEIPNEDIRMILPNACYTSLIVSMNARAFAEACSKRTCSKSQWEIKELFHEMRNKIKVLYPNIYSLCFPNCYKDYGCLEVNPCDEFIKV